MSFHNCKCTDKASLFEKVKNIKVKEWKNWYQNKCPQNWLKNKDDEDNFITALKAVIKYGQHYSSGAERYPQYGSANCDLCKKSVNTCCIGLGEYDLCGECIQIIL